MRQKEMKFVGLDLKDEIISRFAHHVSSEKAEFLKLLDVIDIIANFYKEQLLELIPALISAANDFFAGDRKKFNILPITGKEVLDYYKEDTMIWRLYLALRKMDRFLHLRILRKPYVYIVEWRKRISLLRSPRTGRDSLPSSSSYCPALTCESCQWANSFGCR